MLRFAIRRMFDAYKFVKKPFRFVYCYAAALMTIQL